MPRFAALVALAALLACASAESNKTHDVKPIPESTKVWGLMPYEDIDVTVGTKIIFNVPKGFHDVAVVPTLVEMEACDMNNVNLMMNIEGVIQPDFDNDSTSVTEDGMMYVFTWTPEMAGDYYMVCSIGMGRHCLAGQRFAVKVADGAAGEDVTVMGASEPFWTVIPEYAPMTIKLGDSVRFVSDNQGFHDVTLLKDTCSAETGWDCCGNLTANVEKNILAHEEAELYTTFDFKANNTFIYTPTKLGVHSFVCDVSAHCQFGQRITVTVTETGVSTETNMSIETGENSGASSTSMLASTLAALAAFLAVAH